MTRTQRGGSAVLPEASAPAGPRRSRASQASGAVPAPAGRAGPGRGVPRELLTWIRVQDDNTGRHLAALRPFDRLEFGDGPEAPTEGHVQAVNELLELLRTRLRDDATRLRQAVGAATNVPDPLRMRRVLRHKQDAHTAATRVERIWDFYFELFGQRQSRFGSWLLGCDRIALDCYQYAYLGLGKARSIPAPPAFSYLRTGFSPATFRRGIPLRSLGRQLNPFPLIQLPYHRLVNPWTLGAILHEVCHNLQNDLGLARTIPVTVGERLLRAGVPRPVAAIWVRWNRETFADLAGLLLGGPAVVSSLMDVIGRSPAAVSAYDPRGPHPTPYLRVFLSIELLRRIGLRRDAALAQAIWTRLYRPVRGSMPPALLATFADAHRVVVDAMCFTPFRSLGDRTLAQTLRFEAKEQQMIEEAARRLAAGNDPGVVPERFLIGAARFALDRRLATPEVITTNFYRELARR
jgi:hypothetical protein